MSSSELKLAVFDLDFTVWDAAGVWCDCLHPPFKAIGGKVTDSSGDRVRIYDGIAEAIDYFDDAGIPLAVASRTTQPDWARQLLDLHGLLYRFEWLEIFPSSKVKHFNNLAGSTGFSFSEMLFFDDEMRNIEEVGAMGVEAVHVARGFDPSVLDAGLARFSLDR